ncbi:MAG: 30S ribosomal protein S13 [Dehalococcoidales bacterium]|nr:30S ribosomal protein S13 [Dehalococcoidales bacterium]
MARIAGVDLPRNKQIWVSLQYLYGIGRTQALKIVEKAGIEPTTRTENLTEEEQNKIRDIISREYKIEGDVRKMVSLNIKRLNEIGCYRGTRHHRSLPVNGQRTRTNSRTRKGPRKTVAGRGQKRGMAKT